MKAPYSNEIGSIKKLVYGIIEDEINKKSVLNYSDSYCGDLINKICKVLITLRILGGTNRE